MLFLLQITLKNHYENISMRVFLQSDSPWIMKLLENWNPRELALVQRLPGCMQVFRIWTTFPMEKWAIATRRQQEEQGFSFCIPSTLVFDWYFASFTNSTNRDGLQWLGDMNNDQGGFKTSDSKLMLAENGEGIVEVVRRETGYEHNVYE